METRRACSVDARDLQVKGQSAQLQRSEHDTSLQAFLTSLSVAPFLTVTAGVSSNLLPSPSLRTSQDLVEICACQHAHNKSKYHERAKESGNGARGRHEEDESRREGGRREGRKVSKPEAAVGAPLCVEKVEKAARKSRRRGTWERAAHGPPKSTSAASSSIVVSSGKETPVQFLLVSTLAAQLQTPARDDERTEPAALNQTRSSLLSANTNGISSSESPSSSLTRP